MANIHESEILHVDETGKPIATSYDPGAFSEETIITILNNQITSPAPLEIHCYVRGAYRTIEAAEFKNAKTKNEHERQKFINSSLTLIKGIDTFHIIFAEPLGENTTSIHLPYRK